MQPSVQAMHDERLRELASRPNTQVMKPTYDAFHEPWKVERLQKVMNVIVDIVLQSSEHESDFALRKRCLGLPDVLDFQRKHHQLYWILTDRSIMAKESSRVAIKAMLHVRGRVEEERLPEIEADALATRMVVAALQENTP